MRPILLITALVLLAGCDEEGKGADMDAGSVDGAVAPVDAGPVPNDAEARDAGAETDGGADAAGADAGLVLDAGASDPDAGPPVPCSADRPCPEGFYCETEEGLCHGDGVCRPAPADCSDPGMIGTIRPVCGCDARTYRNECEQRRAGVGVFALDVCADDACSRYGEGCESPQRCTPPHQQCANVGHCTDPLSLHCPGEESLTCGCDGVTYWNGCLIAIAGIGAAHAGACEDSDAGAGRSPDAGI